MTLIKSISGIRGTVGGAAGENLTPPDIVKFTTAYVRFIAARCPNRKPTVVIGRDARISGELAADLVEGTVLACGADVINVGLCTTPGTEMAVITYKADGGIILTASHNPRQWNALKLLNAEGEFLNDRDRTRRLPRAVQRQTHRTSPGPAGRGGRNGAQTPFQGRHRRRELGGRHRHAPTAARARLRGRRAELRTDR